MFDVFRNIVIGEDGIEAPFFCYEYIYALLFTVFLFFNHCKLVNVNRQFQAAATFTIDTNLKWTTYGTKNSSLRDGVVAGADLRACLSFHHLLDKVIWCLI